MLIMSYPLILFWLRTKLNYQLFVISLRFGLVVKPNDHLPKGSRIIIYNVKYLFSRPQWVAQIMINTNCKVVEIENKKLIR